MIDQKITITTISTEKDNALSVSVDAVKTDALIMI